MHIAILVSTHKCSVLNPISCVHIAYSFMSPLSSNNEPLNCEHGLKIQKLGICDDMHMMLWFWNFDVKVHKILTFCLWNLATTIIKQWWCCKVVQQWKILDGRKYWKFATYHHEQMQVVTTFLVIQIVDVRCTNNNFHNVKMAITHKKESLWLLNVCIKIKTLKFICNLMLLFKPQNSMVALGFKLHTTIWCCYLVLALGTRFHSVALRSKVSMIVLTLESWKLRIIWITCVACFNLFEVCDLWMHRYSCPLLSFFVALVGCYGPPCASPNFCIKGILG